MPLSGENRIGLLKCGGLSKVWLLFTALALGMSLTFLLALFPAALMAGKVPLLCKSRHADQKMAEQLQSIALKVAQEKKISLIPYNGTLIGLYSFRNKLRKPI
jgi:hypothetical protein